MTSITANKVFNFVRGAIRSIRGKEDFDNLQFLIVDTSDIGRELIPMISSASRTDVYFSNNNKNSLRQAVEILVLEPFAQYWAGGPNDPDVVIDCEADLIIIKGKVVFFRDLLEDSYTQGIHEFYL